jgi:hypothetical protein
VGLGQIAVRRGDLDVALNVERSALDSPWLIGTARANALYSLAMLHALRAEPAAGHRVLAEADALATPRFAVWSAVVAAYLAMTEGDHGKAAARLESAWAAENELRVPALRSLLQALWAFCLSRTGGHEDQIRDHLRAASPLSRDQVGQYLRAWPDFEAFVVEHALVVEGDPGVVEAWAPLDAPPSA